MANLLPVVEKYVKSIAVIDVFEGNDVLTEFSTKIMGIHAATYDVLCWAQTSQGIGTMLNLALTLR